MKTNGTMMKWIAMLVLSGLAALSFAQPGPGGFAGHDPGRFLEHMSDRLGLTDEQQTQVKEIFDSERATTADDRQALETLHEQMKTLVDNFDAGVAQSTADEIGRVTSRMTYSHVSTMAQVRSVLTDEQRAEMDEMHARMEKHHKHYRGFADDE